MPESTLQPRRRYPPELKLKIVREAISGPQSKAAVARKYDINANMVSNWIREYRSEALWVKKATLPMVPMIVVDDLVAAPPQQPLADLQPKAQATDTRRSCDSVVSIRFNSGHQLSLSHPSDTQLSQILSALA